MKKRIITTLCAAIMICGSVDMHAQGFFKKLGKKVVDNTVNTVTGKASSTVNGAVNSVTGKSGKAVKNAIGGSVGSAAGSAVNQAVRGSVNGGVNNTVGKATKGKVTVTRKKNSREETLERQRRAIVGKDKPMEDEKPTVRLPENHTGLLAPLGYDIEAKMGKREYRPTMPPVNADKQEAWVKKQPEVRELTNGSLIELYKFLKNCENKGLVDIRREALTGTPVALYTDQVETEYFIRRDAIKDLVAAIKETKSNYKDAEYNWEINMNHNNIVRIISKPEYKALVRSGIEPLFSLDPVVVFEELNGMSYEEYAAHYYDEIREYFAKHGGMSNAHKLALTKWDPEPDKEQTMTSSGQMATVLSSYDTGGELDVNGIYYFINADRKYAYLKRVENTMVNDKDIVIPDYVVLKGVKYPVTEIKESSFRGVKIRSVKLPATLKQISRFAFKDCPITEITIPASVRWVQGSAFQMCPNLTKVVFEGKDIDKIDHGCFEFCPKLQSVILPARANELADDAFKDCPMLTNVVLPTNLKKLSRGVFSGCKSLTNLNIPASVTYIDADAFNGCGVLTLSIPSVTNVAEEAFSGCNKLRTLYISQTLMDRFVEDNYSLFIFNFNQEPYHCNPNFKVKVVDNKIVLPASLKVVK